MSRILLVGYHPSVVRLLGGDLSDASEQLYLLEEPTLFTPELPFLHLDRPEAGVIDVRLGRYQQSTEYREIVRRWHEEISFDAVMPGREYGVVAARDIARMLSLPHPSDTAVEACTNKLALRLLCQRAGIRQTAFHEVSGPNDVADFLASHSPAILKPANRHASLGVVRIDRVGDIARAWRHAAADQGHPTGLAPSLSG